jgi:hypothetical protein
LVSLQPSDQLLEIIRRDGLPGDDQHRIARYLGDRLEVFQEVVVQPVDHAQRYMRTPVSDADRVAVGQCARDTTEADRTACADNIFD